MQSPARDTPQAAAPLPLPPLPHPHAHAHASPMRRMKPAGQGPNAPATPATADVNKYERIMHQPSPNRTEAAAAMMHLFASSATKSEGTTGQPTGKVAAAAVGKRMPLHPPVPGAKAKRRYVRKAPRKPTLAAEKLSKITTGSSGRRATDDKSSGKPPSGDNLEGKLDHTDGGDQANREATAESGNGDDVRFFPFREYNRKEKSLGLLCENFLKLYRSDQVSEICLDRAAKQLGVERRRIYDIVNILESIHLVSRKSKNLYNWHGLSALPVSTAAMRKKYADLQLQGGAGAGGYDYNFKDRRRGKSLSKLSQMFVQLFLKKEHCIIPLDQAAKQLIRMEETENEEDRQLKTKIRRLYDVANVLVSVGLIEKLQLSNSRKPVFRWRNRTDHDSETADVEMTSEFTVHPSNPDVNPEKTSSNPAAISHLTSAPSGRAYSMDDTEMKTSQSCDDDSDHNGGDSSDSRSDRGDKRKLVQAMSAMGCTEPGGASVKRVKTRGVGPVPGGEGSDSASLSTSPSSHKVLRFDSKSMPVHPQLILQEQQQIVRQFMQEYIREYVDYIILQQVRLDPPARNNSATGNNTNETSPSAASATTAVVAAPILSQPPSLQSLSTMSATPDEVAASIEKEIHATPISMPSLANRVTNALAGSIHDMLFANTTTSPQSVADLVRLDPRGIAKSIQIGLSQSSLPNQPHPTTTDPCSAVAMAVCKQTAPVPASSASSPVRPMEYAAMVTASSHTPASSTSSSPSSVSSASSSPPSSGHEDIQTQARRLFTVFQPEQS